MSDTDDKPSSPPPAKPPLPLPPPPLRALKSEAAALQSEAAARKAYALAYVGAAALVLFLSIYGASVAYTDAVGLAKAASTKPDSSPLPDSHMRVFIAAIVVKGIVGAALAFLAVRLLGSAERMLVPLRFIHDNPDMVRALTGRDTRIPHAGLRSIVDPSDSDAQDVEDEATKAK